MSVIRRSGTRGNQLREDDRDRELDSGQLHVPPSGLMFSPKTKRDETERRLLKPKFPGASNKPAPEIGGAKGHDASVIGTLEPEKDMEKMGAAAGARFQISKVMRYDGKKLDTRDDRPAREPSAMDSGTDESLKMEERLPGKRYANSGWVNPDGKTWRADKCALGHDNSIATNRHMCTWSSRLQETGFYEASEVQRPGIIERLNLEPCAHCNCTLQPDGCITPSPTGYGSTQPFQESRGNFIQQIDDKIWALYEKVVGEAGGLDSETKRAQSHFFQTKKRKDHDAYLEKLRSKGLDPEARARKLLAGVAEMAKQTGKRVTVTTSSPHGASFFNHGGRAMCRWEDEDGWSAVKVETLPLLDPQFLHKAGSVEAMGSDKAHKAKAQALAGKIGGS